MLFMVTIGLFGCQDMIIGLISKIFFSDKRCE